MKKLGSPPQSYNYFSNMWKMFYPKYLMIPMATHENKCIAAGIFFLYNHTIHHAYSCNIKEFLNIAPNDLIQWWMIKWGNEHGYNNLDSGRTRAGAGNVLFKKRWGGKCVTMPYFYKFFKYELQERQEIKYNRLSNLWSKYMPDFAANRIGPWIIKQIG
jgi:lipid II:glycine glycyltransferase (peptidoglycan interpeptide bridge formation enzyme)